MRRESREQRELDRQSAIEMMTLAFENEKPLRVFVNWLFIQDSNVFGLVHLSNKNNSPGTCVISRTMSCWRNIGVPWFTEILLPIEK
jgi:hypothetical protein